MFRRNMSAADVKDTIVNAFSAFKIDQFQYLKCGQDNRLRVVDNNEEMNGDDLFELAGQGSIYICLVCTMCKRAVISNTKQIGVHV